jgi:hypothetical protein
MKVRLDPFLLSVADRFADLDVSLEVEKVEELLELLVEDAETFLLGGGTIDLATWSTLGKLSRDAFAAAGERIRRAEATFAAIASRGPLEAEAVAEGLDGGDVQVRAALRKIVGRRTPA